MPDNSSDFFNFEINFTDLTLLEANGEYIHVKRLMESPQKIIGNISSYLPSDKWVVKSTITIIHELGYAQLICDFYYDKRIIIVSYASTSKEIHRLDIRCFSFWAQNNGWSVPEPHPNVIREDLEFWKIQWETYLVESDFLSKKIGNRNPQYEDDNIDDNEDNDPNEEEIQKL